jgi:hypothetical protein
VTWWTHEHVHGQQQDDITRLTFVDQVGAKLYSNHFTE